MPTDEDGKMITPVRSSKLYDEDVNSELEAAGQKPNGERTHVKMQGSGNKILSYSMNLDKIDADEEQLRIRPAANVHDDEKV